MERMKQWVILFMRSWASKWNAEKRLPENLQVAFYIPYAAYRPCTLKRPSTGANCLSVAGAAMPPNTSWARRVQLAGDLPLLGHGLVDNGIVVLQVGADAGGGEGGPHGVLVHGVGVFGPHGEVGGVGGELLLQGAHDGLVFKEEYGAGCGGEACQFLGGGLEFVGRHDLAQGGFGELPEFFVLAPTAPTDAGGLGVERKRGCGSTACSTMAATSSAGRAGFC